jgi:hypothetical protein
MPDFNPKEEASAVSFFVVRRHGADMAWRCKPLALVDLTRTDHDQLDNSGSAKCSFGRIRVIRCMVFATKHKCFFAVTFSCHKEPHFALDYAETMSQRLSTFERLPATNKLKKPGSRRCLQY